MSVIELCNPAMWQRVSGQVRVALSRSARARTSSLATLDFLEARQETQLMMGVLLLNSGTCFLMRGGHTFPMISHRSSIPAILRLELVMVPDGLLCVWMDDCILSGPSYRKTVGVHVEFSPKITPLTPWLDALHTPMKSVHAITSLRHRIGVRVESLRSVRMCSMD